jgi:putative transposase
MPRRNRCILPGVPCHITQRGVDRRQTFSSATDRLTYLRLLRDNLADAQVAILGFCLMSNHIHLIAVPEREDSLAILLRRVHGRYAQYYNTRSGRTGHLWQNRFFACVLGESHLWTALAYVDRNPLRAGLVKQPREYPWSSAAAHLDGQDVAGILDMVWWQREACGMAWEAMLREENGETDMSLRRCTYAGRPFGEESFVKEMSVRFGRYWARGRPKKQATAADSSLPGRQLAFFVD